MRLRARDCESLRGVGKGWVRNQVHFLSATLLSKAHEEFTFDVPEREIGMHGGYVSSPWVGYWNKGSTLSPSWHMCMGRGLPLHLGRR